MKKNKAKLNLIDNYIAIYRVLYNCKVLLVRNAEKATLESTKKAQNLQKLCDQTLDLKLKYEKAFEKLKMIDDSFLLLKKQLNDCKGYIIPNLQTCTMQEISDSIKIIENDYAKLKL